MEDIGTALRIVTRKSFFSALRNGGIPLSYVEFGSSSIKICADGWVKTCRLQGYPNPEKFFFMSRGIEAVSFAIAHESIHQVLYKLEGEGVSLALDEMSGGGEVV
jgi:hypothetical protein